MRSILLLLVIVVFTLPGCETPEEKESARPESAGTSSSAEPSASVRVGYDIDADGRILEKLQSCIRNELGAMNDVAPVESGGDWEIRVIARDSRDFRIFSESLITLSTLVLQPVPTGQDGNGSQGFYRVRDHQVTTFPSEDLGSVCEEMMEGVEEILMPEKN